MTGQDVVVIGAGVAGLTAAVRLAEAGAVTSVGSKGDSCDNALAESIIGLYKAELIYRRGPWKTVAAVEALGQLARARALHYLPERMARGMAQIYAGLAAPASASVEMAGAA